MTKDAKTLLYHMYKEYLIRRENHVSKSKAKDFDCAETIHETLFSDWCLEDVTETLRELDQLGFVNNFYADNTVYYCELTNNAISVMENQKKENILNVLNFISNFIP